MSMQTPVGPVASRALTGESGPRSSHGDDTSPPGVTTVGVLSSRERVMPGGCSARPGVVHPQGSADVVHGAVRSSAICACVRVPSSPPRAMAGRSVRHTRGGPHGNAAWALQAHVRASGLDRIRRRRVTRGVCAATAGSEAGRGSASGGNPGSAGRGCTSQPLPAAKPAEAAKPAADAKPTAAPAAAAKPRGGRQAGRRRRRREAGPSHDREARRADDHGRRRPAGEARRSADAGRAGQGRQAAARRAARPG